MLAHSSALDTWLDSNPTATWMADLYTFTLVDGTIVRLTNYGRDLDYGGNTYLGSTLSISRAKIKRQIGLATSTCDVELMTDGTVTIDGAPLLVGMAQGRWDAAQCVIQRILMPAPGDTSMGAFTWFGGTIGQIAELGSLRAKFEVRGPTQRLNRPIPRILFSPACSHEVFDSGCGLNENDYAVTGTIGSGSTLTVVQSGNTDHPQNVDPPAAPSLSYTSPAGVKLPPATYYVRVTYTTAYGETVASDATSLSVPENGVLRVTAPANVTGNTGWNVYISIGAGDEQLQNQAPLGTGAGVHYDIANTGIVLSGIRFPVLPTTGWWSQGIIRFTSGALSGRTAFVQTSDNSGALTLAAPLPLVPAAGDSYRLIPGCSRVMFVCKNKFNNLVHFTGFPFTPTPEASA